MASRVTLEKTLHKAPAHATHLGRTPSGNVISVSVIVRRKNPLKLSELKGRRLSHAEFNAQYAANPADFENIRVFAKNHGLSVDEAASSLPRRTIVLKGTAEAMEQAFGVQLNSYEDTRHKKRFHAFEGTISVPEDHAPAIEAVLGLDSRPIATPHFRRRDDSADPDKRKKQQPTTPSLQPQPFSAVQVGQLYGFPTNLNGSGQTIGILELGGGYTDSDLQTYFQGVGLSTPNVTAVSVDGGSNSPGDPNGADGEVELDIEVAGSVANAANIAVYFAPNTDQGFIDAITTAVHDTTNKPSVLSISWGGPESAWSAASVTALDNACQSAGALGVTITVASGDSGSSDGTNGTVVDFPASSPHVLACGGTELFANGTSIAEEVVWDDQPQGGATGGGFSGSFAVPTWQASALPSGSSGRGVPDVSGDASPESGYNIIVDGQPQVVGGTSAVAPLYAGLIALANQQLASQNSPSAGFINPTLYENASAFNDITQGNNGAYSAGPGWDACTGLGSPKGAAIVTALAAVVATAASGS
ncbi:S8/S53 family peptidase [Alloacidobacterium dinghuense]|uniref:S8/S53 family peptidase n=1 Tax=Alloacidobacterium dinghuense TaxID=2763107 RepID=A0A7G8BFH1_9BACT|nr:S53 family peptidase [Alloacidobacterium dinghuense]QNI31291.1 S8/S53 family peptidase [Alloacidobacterium dinghuense]